MPFLKKGEEGVCYNYFRKYIFHFFRYRFQILLNLNTSPSECTNADNLTDGNWQLCCLADWYSISNIHLEFNAKLTLMVKVAIFSCVEQNYRCKKNYYFHDMHNSLQLIFFLNFLFCQNVERYFPE